MGFAPTSPIKKNSSLISPLTNGDKMTLKNRIPPPMSELEEVPQNKMSYLTH